jgi:hypothetical protein
LTESFITGQGFLVVFRKRLDKDVVRRRPVSATLKVIDTVFRLWQLPKSVDQGPSVTTDRFPDFVVVEVFPYVAEGFAIDIARPDCSYFTNKR